MKRLNKYFPYEKNLKNRSGKHKNLLLGRPSIFCCVPMSQLKDWMLREVAGAANEYYRRKAKIERRYGHKIDVNRI